MQTTSPDTPELSVDDIARIAARVSEMMQLDRMRHHVGTAPDLAAQANIPAYLTQIFEDQNAVSGPITNEALYDLVNKRVARLEAALYLMRVELEHRDPNDPAEIYADPMAMSAYGERVAQLSAQARTFSFEPAVMGHGWHAVEVSNDICHRWMRPTEAGSLACLPHLGQTDQILDIDGHVLHADQIDGLTIRFGEITAEIQPNPDAPQKFTASLRLTAADVAQSTYVALTFEMTDFRQPNETDTRLLGANIRRFTIRPGTE